MCPAVPPLTTTLASIVGHPISFPTKKAGRLEMSNSTNFSSFRGHLGAKMEGERAFVGISGISDKRPAYASVVCLRPVSGAPQRLFVALFIAPEHKKCEQKRCYIAHSHVWLEYGT